MRFSLYVTLAAVLAVSPIIAPVTPAAAQAAQKEAPLPPLSPSALLTALSDPRADGDKLAARVRAAFVDRRPDRGITRGAVLRTEDLVAAWAFEMPGIAAGQEPVVTSTDGSFTLKLKRLGASDVYAGAVKLPEGAGFAWTCNVNGEQKGRGQVEVYTTPPELKARPEVSKGKLTQMPDWKSQIFPNTVRPWWVYVPAQYTPDKPACVMVFQDGRWVREWVSTCFDNMIASGEVPVTVCIFLDPGRAPEQRPEEEGRNRPFEYNTLSDQYARFLLEEILPEVEKTVRLRQDAAGRAIAGSSSGGICAFTVAWQRPDQFHKVVSWIGSFVNLAPGKTGLEGGHNYPSLIRQSKQKNQLKPIRVFLQDGANDLDNDWGNWPLANQQMAKALAFAGYDHKFVYGNGFHNGNHGRVLFPDTLRWLWRDEAKPSTSPKSASTQ